MARILLGCLIGKAPSQVVLCYCAILNFVYIAQYPSHDDNTLRYLDNALKLFHDSKHILTDPNLVPVREHLNIPKFHTMLHYAQAIRDFGTTDNYNTEMFERFHIDCAKEGWRASNFRDEVPQMVQWLARQEKVAMFESYLEHYESLDDLQAEKEADGYFHFQRPSALNQPLASIQSKHHCPSFSHHLICYLNQFLNRSQGQAIPRSQLHSTQLPFDNISVWHAFEFGRDTLGNNIDGSQELDAVKAKPRRGIDGIDRFDTVLVAHTSQAESTGLQGMKIGRLCVIFKLPEVLKHFEPVPKTWPTHHLAYVEWYKLSSRPGTNHNMYAVFKSAPLANGVVSGEIVLLTSIRQSYYMVAVA
ncbi:hypothetical protein BDR03DRAFT_934627 [Suillus americanus]|nr:hypothetical protein BDR03DRAFT_934627 [Suillus americanus]